jgi:hypothetical protein
VKGVASLIATLHDFTVASPLAQVITRLTAVKSVPATAVLLAVLQRTLAAPSDPPVRLTTIVLTPRFSTAPDVAEDNDIVPADALARAVAPLPRLAPKKMASAAIVENTIRCECIRSPQILFGEQLRSWDENSGG